jgi:hypothetical protein
VPDTNPDAHSDPDLSSLSGRGNAHSNPYPNSHPSSRGYADAYSGADLDAGCGRVYAAPV